jgi:integral membrane sensor domain MASE1
VVAAALLAGAYTVAGKFGLTLAVIHPSATPVWPPTGIALATLLLLGTRMWPGMALGAFVVNVTTAGSVATSIGIAAGNTLEAVVGAWLVGRFANGPHAFDRARDVFKFAALAAVLATALSATFGVTSLALGGFARWSDYASIWTTWWLGDAAGALIVAPLLVVWAIDARRPWSRRQACEALLLGLSVLLVGLAVFGGWLPESMRNAPLEFLCAPPLLWAAFRFGQREAATAAALLSALATWGTLRGLGPFAREMPNESLLLLQAFMATSAMTAIAVAAVVAERKRLVGELRDALDHVKTLRGLLPICAGCNKIRTGEDWVHIQTYVLEHSEAQFTHGLCPACLLALYPEMARPPARRFRGRDAGAASA